MCQPQCHCEPANVAKPLELAVSAGCISGGEILSRGPVNVRIENENLGVKKLLVKFSVCP